MFIFFEGYSLINHQPLFSPAVNAFANDILTFTQDGSIYMSEVGQAGSLLLMPGVQLTMGADYPTSFIKPANLWMMTGSSLGGPHGVIAPQNIIVAQNATFTAGSLKGVAPLPETPYTYNIGNFWNAGGSLVDLSGGELTIGMPGFVQTGGFLSSETNVSDGQGDNWLMLGDIHKGASVASIVESIWNADSQNQHGIFAFSGDGFAMGLNPVPMDVGAGRTMPGGGIDVDTSQLGAHQETIRFGHDTMFISDRIV